MDYERRVDENGKPYFAVKLSDYKNKICTIGGNTKAEITATNWYPSPQPR